MTKLLSTLAWLAAFFALPWAVVGLNPALRYQIDDAKLIWIGRQIYGPPQDYDYVLLGSSHIWNGLDAPLIARELGGRAINLGFNWGGRDAQGLVAREFLARHRVGALVVEVWNYEHPTSHEYYPFLARPGDVLEHFETHKLSRGETWSLAAAFREPAEFALAHLGAAALAGYRRLAFAALGLESKYREALAEADAHAGSQPLDGPPEAWRTFQDSQEDYASPPRISQFDPDQFLGGGGNTLWGYELERLAEECRGRGTRLIFVFLPHRENVRPHPKYLTYLLSLGEVVEMPRSILAAKRSWRDGSHLNIAGARLMTEHFIDLERKRRLGQGW